MARMDYRAAIAYIIERSGYDRGFVANPFDAETVGLRRTAWLLEALGHPEARYPAVHVAGTKGKGSTAACADAILRAAGQRVGLYTSPHLHTFRERIRLDGEPIGEDAFAALTAEIVPLNAHLAREHPDWGEATAFEVATVLAVLAFARAAVDVAVVEVGLGGRLDATNVLTPTVSVITAISLDHTAILGDTLAEIAGEKGGIIKPGVPVVSSPQPVEARVVLERLAAERGSPLLLGGRDFFADGVPERFDLRAPGSELRALRLALGGRHQVENAASAVVACRALDRAGIVVPEAAVRAGLAAVVWPGRLEVVASSPTVVVDGAHNVDSAGRLAEALGETFRWRRLTLVLGITRDKQVEQMLAVLAPLADRVVATASHHPRAAAPDRIVAAARAAAGPALAVEQAPSVAEALRRALAGAAPDDLVCVTGSLYAVSEAREALGLAEPASFEQELLYR
ncbi:MAG TPA: folylpolyglutamate synthase/dihydrofolate synthase family protein [Thermomicrobiaceae bacterium]|nr:folylpolyglutamate synthase/dihydrofolate synthase family protein [Thermomicrobiaceae bacterium]